MIKYIFFDFDGVLAESVNVKTEAFRQMYIQYGEAFAQQVVDFHLANGGVSRFEKVKIYNGEWLGEELSETRILELADIFSRLAIEGVINAPEVSGASAFLQNSQQYTKYIITGTPTTEIREIIKARQIEQYFAGAYGSPETKDFWVKKILEENHIDSKECVFVGDALADYRAATANNITFVLRETKEGVELFKTFEGYRIKDLTYFHQLLGQIDSESENE